MAPTPIVTKKLTTTDRYYRLPWPSRLLQRVPGQNLARTRTSYTAKDADGRVWRFCCKPRARGYYKPVIVGDWLRFVKSKNLDVGDQVIFYEDSSGREDFVVMVRKVGMIRLFGNDIIGYGAEE